MVVCDRCAGKEDSILGEDGLIASAKDDVKGKTSKQHDGHFVRPLFDVI